EKGIGPMPAYDGERKFRFHLQRTGRTDPGPSQPPRLRGNLPDHSGGADLFVRRPKIDLGCSLLCQPPCLCTERKGNHLRFVERVILRHGLSQKTAALLARPGTLKPVTTVTPTSAPRRVGGIPGAKAR